MKLRHHYLCNLCRSFALAWLMLAVAGPVGGATLTWIDPAGGSAASASNWSPAQVPTAIDALLFNISSAFNVSWNSTVPASTSQTYRSGTVTETFSSTHTVSGTVTVGTSSGDNATLNITTGQLTSNGQVAVGLNSGSTGTLTVTTGDAFLVTGGAATDLVVGDAGTGTLNVTSGGSVEVSDDFIVGRTFLNGVGTATVTGFDSALSVPSNLVTTGSDADIIVGSNGQGTLTISNNGTVTSASDVIIAPNSGGSGTVTVQDAGGGDAFLSADASLQIGFNPSGSLGSGSGALNVNNGGRVAIAGVTTVGDPQSPISTLGTLHVEGDGQFTTGSLVFNAHGVLQFTGGRIHVNGPTFDPPGTDLVIAGTGSPVLELQTAGMSLSHSFGNALQIGTGAGAGTMRLMGGGSCTITGGTSDVQIGGTNAGTLTLDPNSVFHGDRNFSVGGSGAVGNVTVSALALLDLFNCSVSGSGNSIIVGGAGSQLVADGFLSTGAGGTLTVNLGGTVQAGTASNAGTTNVALAAALNVTNTLTNTGDIVMTGGALTAATLDFDGSGTLTGRGTATARVLADSPSAVITASGGNLTLGNAADPAGFFSTGTLNVGSVGVTLNDSDAATLGNVTIAGGTLSPLNGGTLAAGTSIVGSGRINGPLSNAGTITPTGTGLLFSGLLGGVGQGISGTSMNFLSGGGFTGAGLVDAAVDLDSGATLTATGPLSLGKSSDTLGFVSDGTMTIGAQAVTLLDANAALIGNASLAGGSLSLPSGGGTLLSGRTISGKGTINGTLSNGGTLAPAGAGLEFSGMVFGVGQGISGSEITLLNGGGFQGTGTVDAVMTANAGSTINAQGSLTMGKASFLSGVVLDGTMNLDINASVTLLSARSVALGSATNLFSNGSLTCTPGLSLASGRTLTGTGSITSSAFTNSGRISPGFSVGTLTMNSDYTQTSTGELQVTIGGYLPGVDHDRLVVSGSASLGGILRPTFINGFSPVAGDEFVILTSGSLAGQFGQVLEGGGLPINLTIAATYTPTTARLQILPDADNDGAADAADCAPNDATAFAAPTDVQNLVFGLNGQTMTWTSQSTTSGSGTRYDLMRGDATELPVGSGASESCLASNLAGASASDGIVPAPGGIVYYLVRAHNNCGMGPWGFQSNGVEEINSSCP